MGEGLIAVTGEDNEKRFYLASPIVSIFSKSPAFSRIPAPNYYPYPP